MVCTPATWPVRACDTLLTVRFSSASLFTTPAEDASYFPDRCLVTGHRPTADRSIHRSRGHFSVDCGCVFGGSLGVLRLDDLQEFYVSPASSDFT